MPNQPIDLSNDNFWDVFESAEPEQQIRYFLDVLDSGKMDSDAAFEMLNTLRPSLATDAAGHARYAELVQQVREKAPKAYRSERRYFHHTLITFAIEDGRLQDIPTLLEPFREETDLDTYVLIVDELAYHGLERDLVPVMMDALPKIKAEPDLFEWAAEEFAGDIMRLMLWIYLDTADSPSPKDADFLASTEPYGKWTEGWLEKCVPRFTAASPSDWQPDDFALSLEPETYQDNLSKMLAEFVAECHRDGIPYERGYMFLQQILSALDEQTKGARQRAMRRAATGKSKKSRKKKKALPSPLIPSFTTLNKTLANLATMLSGRPYRLVATLELLPRYLQYLLRLGLVSAYDVEHARSRLRAFLRDIANVLDYYEVDQRCAKNLFAAWEK